MHDPLSDLMSLDEPGPLIIARPREYPAEHLIDWHTHTRAQLLYAEKGVMEVETAAGTWIIPPQRAVWIPPEVAHKVQAQGAPLSLRSLYIDRSALDGLPRDCCVVTVSPLLRELILSAMGLPLAFENHSAEMRLCLVLLDQIRTVPETPLHLPATDDPTLGRITAAILEDPSDQRSLKEWGNVVGASDRTLARKFLDETGMTFAQWRQQARLLSALARLAHGESVTTVAYDLGYAQQSAFIGMFRRALGKTPGRYFDDDEKDEA